MTNLKMREWDIDPINYAAICHLEKKGITAPTESQIEKTEKWIKFYYEAANEVIPTKIHELKIKEL